MEKIHFYEYIDIIDPRNKLSELERKGKRENKYSWNILVDEIKNKVIINNHIEDFIEKVNKNILFSEIYYKSNNKNIDMIMEIKNEENNEYLFELQRIILLFSLNEENFYNIQKLKIYEELEITEMVYFKLINGYHVHDKLKNLICKNIDIFKKRKEVIKLINKKKEHISYEDDILMNIISLEDMIEALKYIKSSNIKYKNIILPDFIKIKEINQNPATYIDIQKIEKEYYDIIINYLKEINNKKIKIPHLYIKKKNNMDLFEKKHKQTFCIYYNNKEYVHDISYIYKINIVKSFLLINIIIFYNYIYYFDRWKKKHKKKNHYVECVQVKYTGDSMT